MRCSLCNCIEFEAREYTPLVCVCHHHKDSHVEVNGMDLAIENTLKDMEQAIIQIKLRMERLDMLNDRLKRLLDVGDGENERDDIEGIE